MTSPTVERLVIIGSGPAGYTAAIYAGRANLKPLVFEGFQAGGLPGGQLMTTTEVENFPGFPEGVTGPDLMIQMKAQAERWGARLVTEDVTFVDFSQRPFLVNSETQAVWTHSIVIATGATAKRLSLPGEAQFWNRGISACATCDGAAPLFRGVPLVVVGGGDTAAEEAIYLTKYSDAVHLLVRGDKMRASKAMQERVLHHPRITIHWCTEPLEAIGDEEHLTGVRIKNRQTGETELIAAQGLFYAIGHTPNTSLFEGQLELDGSGYIVTRSGSVETNLAGVFAAGDVQDHQFRQAITAAGTGCMAALLAERWLSAQGLDQPVVPAAAQSHLQSMPMASQEIDIDAQSELTADSELTDSAKYQPIAPQPDPKGTTADEPAIVKSESGALPAEPTAPQTPAAPKSELPGTAFDLKATCHQGSYALRRLYHESDRLIVVKYAAVNCGPCHALKPIMQKVVAEFEGQIYYIEIDIEQDPEIAAAAEIIGTPTVQLFRDKAKLHEVRGVKQKSHYCELITSHITAPSLS